MGLIVPILVRTSRTASPSMRPAKRSPPFAGIYRVGFAHGQHLPSAKSQMNLGQLGLLYLAMASSRMSEVLDELGAARRQAIPRTS